MYFVIVQTSVMFRTASYYGPFNTLEGAAQARKELIEGGCYSECVMLVKYVEVTD